MNPTCYDSSVGGTRADLGNSVVSEMLHYSHTMLTRGVITHLYQNHIIFLPCT